MAAWWQKEYNKVRRTFPGDSAHSNVNPVIPNRVINGWTRYTVGLQVSSVAEVDARTQCRWWTTASRFCFISTKSLLDIRNWTAVKVLFWLLTFLKFLFYLGRMNPSVSDMGKVLLCEGKYPICGSKWWSTNLVFCCYFEVPCPNLSPCSFLGIQVWYMLRHEDWPLHAPTYYILFY